ncbi:hypothetical protein JKJ11_15870 [Vibrio sp. SCSIO 43133]|uniref:hypothetical protein n=1 Tax=Vibrio sp. SCSIO 43133 TaxID=2802577 RepID=UPI0020752CAB|nr:hypothetical protein [Vibrio sp. SCSIO 43133]USE00372.1 hypothetical protein JKJ11_15870 [Vibrio sp. SCSIO 43133]
MTLNLTKQTLASSIGLILALSTSSVIASEQALPYGNFYHSFDNVKDRNTEEKGFIIDIKGKLVYDGPICSFDFNTNHIFNVNFEEIQLTNEQNFTTATESIELNLNGNGCDMAFFNITTGGRKAHKGPTDDKGPAHDLWIDQYGHNWFTLGGDHGVIFATVLNKQDQKVTADVVDQNTGDIKISNAHRIETANAEADWLRVKEFATNNALTLTTIMKVDHRKFSIWNHTEDFEFTDKAMTFTTKIL